MIHIEETGYDTQGNVILWKRCVKCRELVWTTIKDDNQVYCGGNIGCLAEISKQKQAAKQKEKIPDDIRWKVWERDNFTCQKCGGRRNLTIDHIHPESKGGKATLENCQTLCNSCNSRKGAR